MRRKPVEIINLACNCESQSELDSLFEWLKDENLTLEEKEELKKVSMAYDHAIQILSKNRERI